MRLRAWRQDIEVLCGACIYALIHFVALHFASAHTHFHSCIVHFAGSQRPLVTPLVIRQFNKEISLQAMIHTYHESESYSNITFISQ